MLDSPSGWLASPSGEKLREVVGGQAADDKAAGPTQTHTHTLTHTHTHAGHPWSHPRHPRHAGPGAHTHTHTHTHTQRCLNMPAAPRGDSLSLYGNMCERRGQRLIAFKMAALRSRCACWKRSGCTICRRARSTMRSEDE